MLPRMNKTFALLAQTFESSCGKTQQYLAFHRTFKREFTKLLQSLGAAEVQVWKPNHFDASGFFRTPNGQAWYFSLSDLRWSKENLLVRTAKDYRDFTGGTNQFATLNNPDAFAADLRRILHI